MKIIDLIKRISNTSYTLDIIAITTVFNEKHNVLIRSYRIDKTGIRDFEQSDVYLLNEEIKTFYFDNAKICIVINSDRG